LNISSKAMTEEQWPDHAPESPRSPSSAPTPASRHHDDEEDAQISPSHIQKRPRLDSGSRAVRSLSAGPILSPPPKDSSPPLSQTTVTPSKITLHVRNIPASQDDEASPTMVAPVSSPLENEDVVPGSSESAPIEITDVEEATDEMDSINTIKLVHDDLVDRFFQEFPYLDRNPQTKPLQMAKNILKHLDNEKLDETLLPTLTHWLNKQDALFINQKYLWKKVFHSHRNLWDQFGNIMQRLYIKQ
jgi:hypothetical protein